uniref:Uncharacterized protein n=1 Tax=Rhizophagus irregularis (strain DAOM 181602 / DAOM 197198 / MUCL 43194) TaxID=747089 RepID=U9TJZ7_RHIID
MNIIKSDEEGRREMRNIFSIGIKRQVKIVFVEIQSRNKWRGGDLLVFHHSSLLAEPQNQWENSKSRWVKDINFSILPSEGTRLLDPATESERSAQFNNESFNVGGSKRNLERDHEKSGIKQFTVEPPMLNISINNLLLKRNEKYQNNSINMAKLKQTALDSGCEAKFRDAIKRALKESFNHVTDWLVEELPKINL